MRYSHFLVFVRFAVKRMLRLTATELRSARIEGLARSAVRRTSSELWRLTIVVLRRMRFRCVMRNWMRSDRSGRRSGRSGTSAKSFRRSVRVRSAFVASEFVSLHGLAGRTSYVGGFEPFRSFDNVEFDLFAVTDAANRFEWIVTNDCGLCRREKESK
jgi:hypothetical protein